MAFRIKRGTFTSRNTTGTQTISGLGFRPGAILIFQRGSHNSAGIYSFGMSDGAGGHGAFHNVVTNWTASRGGRDTRIITRMNAGGTWVSAAYVSSVNNNGFTLTFTTATVSYAWDYLAFESDIQAKLVVLPGSATGNRSLNFGFRPSTLFSIPVPTDMGQQVHYGIGKTDSRGVSRSSSFRGRIQDFNAPFRTTDSSDLLRVSNVDGTNLIRMTLRGYTATGADITVQSNESTWTTAHLALGPQVISHLDGFTTDGVTSRNVGFRPSAVITDRRPVNSDNPGNFDITMGWTDDSLSRHAFGSAGVQNYTGNWANSFVRANFSGRENHGTITAYTDTGYNVSFSGNNTTYNALSIGERNITLAAPSGTLNSLSSSELSLSEGLTLSGIDENLIGHSSEPTTVIEGPPPEPVLAYGFGGGYGGVIGTFGAAQHPILATSDLEVQSTLHEPESNNLRLAQFHTLAASNLNISTKSSNITLLQRNELIGDDDTIGYTSDEVSLVQNYNLLADSSRHTVASPELGLSSVGTLSVSSSIHGLMSDSLSLSQLHRVIAANAGHAPHSSEVDLIESRLLAIQSSLHELYVQGAGVYQNHTIASQSASHGHTVASLSIDQQHMMSVLGAHHEHMATSIDINQYTLLSKPEGALHILQSPRMRLSQAQILAILNAEHELKDLRARIINLTELGYGFGGFRPGHAISGGFSKSEKSEGRVRGWYRHTGEIQQVAEEPKGRFREEYKRDGEY